MVYTCEEILFSHKKESGTGTCYNVEEPRKRYTKSKKSETKYYMLHKSIYTEYPESREIESRLVVIRDWGWERIESNY